MKGLGDKDTPLPAEEKWCGEGTTDGVCFLRAFGRYTRFLDSCGVLTLRLAQCLPSQQDQRATGYGKTLTHSGFVLLDPLLLNIPTLFLTPLSLDKGLPSPFLMKEAEPCRKHYQRSGVAFKRESGTSALNRQTLGTGRWKPCRPGWSPAIHAGPCSTTPTAEAPGEAHSALRGFEERSRRAEEHLAITQGAA